MSSNYPPGVSGREPQITGESKIEATELRPGDVLLGGSEVIGEALAHWQLKGWAPNNPNARPYDPALDVGYPVRYSDGGEGVTVFEREQLVTVIEQRGPA